MKAAQLLSHDYVRAGRVLKLGLAAVGVAACFAMTGCYNSVFDETSLQQSGARQPIEVQSEQVTVKQEVVDCAVDAGLFEKPLDMGSRYVARLTQKGRDLGFSDDISIGEAGYNQPYSQIRGKFPIEFREVTRIRDVEKGVKRVEARAGVKIAHECFHDPLPLMGIRNGQIAENLPVAFEFDQYGGDWRITNVLH